MEDSLQARVPGAGWADVDNSHWTWLTGPDGKAVRVVPPEVPDAG